MGDTIPAQLKGLQLAPFAKRATQLEKFKPIISYWLRFHMVQKILASGLHSVDQGCTAYTTDLMERLEQAKAANPHEDAIMDDVAASAYCEQFALQTFAKGEKDMTENRATSNTVDTLMAASTFLEMLSIWKTDADPAITSKTKYAKYHALRILKAIKAHEDPNLTNPVQETPQQESIVPDLDPRDPEVQSIVQPPSQNPYQSYVESAPNTNAQPSPSFSAPNISPPPNLPSAPTGYNHSAHNDVSPMSQPDLSRHGSVASVGGGYFPRTAPPTFSAENTATSLPTAPSFDDEPPTSAIGVSSLPTDSRLPQAPRAPDPSSFDQNSASPLPQNPFPSPPPQSTYRSPPGQSPYAAPPPRAPPASQQPPMFQPAPAPLPQQHHYNAPTPQPHHQPRQTPLPNPYAQPPAAPVASSQGPPRNDEASIAEATKHAKWAISALNFDDAATAVKELRIALRALGTS